MERESVCQVRELGFPWASSGTGFLLLDTSIDHPPADASIVLRVDKNERRWSVRLPEGIRLVRSGPGSPRSPVVMRRIVFRWRLVGNILAAWPLGPQRIWMNSPSETEHLYRFPERVIPISLGGNRRFLNDERELRRLMLYCCRNP